MTQPTAFELSTNYEERLSPWGHPAFHITPECVGMVCRLRNGEDRIHRLPPSADRGKLRSRTYEGIAAAMAEQWGNLEGEV